MQDQVIKGTGNSRYLKSSIPEDITLSELVALLRAGTFPIDFNGLNEEGIQTLGTPINTATLLKGTTGQAFGYRGLPANRALTVNDILMGLSLKTGGQDPTEETVGQLGQFYWNSSSKVLYKCVNISGGKYTWQAVNNTFKVGDILTTTRNDSEDWWALCNGDEVDPIEYPDLYKLLPITESPGVAINNISGPGSHGNTQAQISFINDCYFISCYGATSSYFYIRYRKKGTTSWSTVNIESSDNSLPCSKVVEFNGRCVFAYGDDSTYNTAKITYANTGWPNTTSVAGITTKALWGGTSATGDGVASGIAVANGKLIVSGTRNARTGTPYKEFIVAWSDDLEGTWTTKVLWSTTSGTTEDYKTNISYINGMYIAMGRYYNSEMQKYTARIAYSPTLDGSWSIVDLWEGDMWLTQASDICYDGTKYIITGTYINHENSTTYTSEARIAYADTLDGTWTIKTLDSKEGAVAGGQAMGATSIIFNGNTYFVTGARKIADGSSSNTEGFVAYTDDISDKWESKSTWGYGYSGTAFSHVGNAVYEEGLFQFAGVEYHDSHWYLPLGTIGLRKVLPTINTGDTYTYMKAKES